ncbi:MAG TPA: AAA family ATPase, partial [Candidatus Binatia bacterium]|nr:AAA family ATPase [Candidatus Binatia bacterium]
LKAVWSDVKVSPGVLKVCLRRIRQALGDSSTKPHFIETKHRQGYRFIAPIAASPQPVSSSKFEVSGLESEPVPSPQPPAPNFVGRGAELRQLERWLEKALRGERRLVFVTGEPGIGKTTVVNACLERVTVQGRIAIGRGQCIEHYGPGEAYLPVLEALGRLCREPGGSRLIDWLRQHAPTWLVQMPAFLNATDLEALQRKIQGTTRERMLREMLEAVEVLTEQQPLVLVLEDLHWSDVSTLELLAAAARRQERARMLIIGTYRPVEMLSKEHPLNEVMQELYAHNLCAELALELLSEADVAEYLCTRFPVNALPADLARALHQRTEGNPLFLVNVVDDLVAQEVIAQGEEGWTLQGGIQAIEGQVPESIRHLITKQSKRLLPVEQRILQAASVAGIEFSAAAVAAALEADEAEVEEWCAGLAARQHFLRRTGISQWPDGTVAEHYGFLHALYQHLWHERVGMGRRRQLHLRIGERQEAAYGDRTGEIAAELAVHFEQGRDYPRAVRYRAQAAEQAVQRYAHQEAVAHLTKSLELLNTLPETPERTQQELALRTTLGITLQANRGYGNPVVEQAYARARELSQKVREPAQLFRVLFGLFQLHVTRAEYQTAHELGRQIIDLAQSAREPALLVEAHGAVGIVLFFLGELAASRTQFERSMVLYNPSQHRTHAVTYGQDPWVACRSSSAEVLWLLGYPAQALQKANESVTFAQELSHPFSLAFALYSAALVSQFRRDVSAVQQQAEVLLTLAREQGFPLWELGATNLQGWALAEQGQGTEGITLIRQSSSARRATSTALRMPYHQARLAEAHGKARQTEEGLTLLEKALMTAANTGEFWWKAELYRLKGELLLQSRQVQASPEQVQTSPGKSLVPSPHPPSSNTRAEAEKCFRQAVDLARRQSAKSLELRAVMSLSRLWQQQGKKDEARRMLAEIYGWFTEGFDTADLREAKALLAALA